MAKYNYKIELENVQDIIKEAINGGYSAYIILNGEYYEVTAAAVPEDVPEFWEV